MLISNFQLPDCNARTFTSEILRKAMSDTIASLNKYAEEFGITEVLPSFPAYIGCLHVSLTAKPNELLCN